MSEPEGLSAEGRRLANALARAKELEDRLDELRSVVQESLAAHEAGTPVETIFSGLRRTLEHVPAGRWDQDACIIKAHEWNDLYGEPPAAVNWNPTLLRDRGYDPELLARYMEGDWPSLRTVARLFGGTRGGPGRGYWNTFLLAAGFEPRDPTAPKYDAGKPGPDGLPVWTGWRQVQSFRSRAGLSQAELAERAGVHQHYVGLLERGARTNPTIRVVLGIALALGIGPRVLMEHETRVSSLTDGQNHDTTE